MRPGQLSRSSLATQNHRFIEPLYRRKWRVLPYLSLSSMKLGMCIVLRKHLLCFSSQDPPCERRSFETLSIATAIYSQTFASYIIVFCTKLPSGLTRKRLWCFLGTFPEVKSPVQPLKSCADDIESCRQKCSLDWS